MALTATTAAATGTITNDDTAPVVSIAVTPSSIAEDAAAGNVMTYTVSLSNPSSVDTVVTYTLTGSATEGTDYVTAATRTVTILAGQTSATFTVDPTSDTVFESNESVIATVTTATGGATVSATNNVATGTITDNDQPTVAVSVSPASVAEDGATNLVYTFTLSNPSAFATTVNYTLSGSATNGTDYTGSALTGTVTIPAGSTTATITIDPTTDTTFEGNETVIATITSASSNSVALTATTAAATGTITDDDLPTLSINSVSAAERSGFEIFTVALSNPSSIATTVSLTLANGTGANAATIGTDTGAQSTIQVSTDNGTTWTTSTTATFSAGNTSVLVRVPLLQDSLNESNETFTLTATRTSGTTANLSASGTGTIVEMVSLAVNDVQHWTFNEGAGATTTNIYPDIDQVGTLTDGVAGGTNRIPTFTANGHIGAGMQFNGVWSNTSANRDGGYVALSTAVTDPLRGDGAGGGSASLVFWIRTTQTGGTIGWNSPSVIGMENNGGTVDVQWGWLDSTGRIGFGMADEAGIMSTNPINDGTWHAVAINHNFTTGASEVWVDGVLNSSGTLLPGAIIPNKFLGFGVTADDGAATDRYLNATLDDVRIYNRVLSASQIQAIFAVENNNLGANAVLDNDGGLVRFTITADDFSSINVTGAPIGSTITDGTNSVTITATGQSVDITTWNKAELGVSGLGTNSAMLEVTANGNTSGDSITQHINIVTGTTVFNGTTGNDTLTGTASADFVGGGAGADTLSGGGGNDRIIGGAGNDVINGGAGNDVIIGGTGSDTLTGGSGADVLKWSLGDQGTAGTPAIDQITDFDVAAKSAGGDILDLRDLLQGEGGANNLQNYLDFQVTGGNTVLRISTNGAFAGGTYAAGAEDQRIVFQGVANLGNSLGLGASATDAQIIQELITRGKLITD